MGKTLTIVITNADDAFMEGFWHAAKESAMEDVGGFDLPERETIEIDAELMIVQDPNIFSELMANIAIGHLVTSIDKFFNSQKLPDNEKG